MFYSYSHSHTHIVGFLKASCLATKHHCSAPRGTLQTHHSPRGPHTLSVMLLVSTGTDWNRSTSRLEDMTVPVRGVRAYVQYTTGLAVSFLFLCSLTSFWLHTLKLREQMKLCMDGKAWCVGYGDCPLMLIGILWCSCLSLSWKAVTCAGCYIICVHGTSHSLHIIWE